jgi:very-short-patch-repair endonuclease
MKKPLSVSSWVDVPHDHWQRAKEMRRDPTEAEQVLWRGLRARKLNGKFRRQHPVGPYVVDFYSRDLGLVIEVDGSGHNTSDQREYDEQRDAWLKSTGLIVKRYSNDVVLTNLRGVLSDIAESLTPHCPPAGGGKDKSG